MTATPKQVIEFMVVVDELRTEVEQLVGGKAALQSEIERLRQILDGTDRREAEYLALIEKKQIEIERLRAALRALMDDVERPITGSVSQLLAEAAMEIERLRAAYDSRGGEMDSMRMVLAETQKWNEDRLGEIERLRALVIEQQERIIEIVADNNDLRRAALEPRT